MAPAAVLTPEVTELRVQSAVEVLYETRGEALTRDQVMAPALAGRWSVSLDKTINMTQEERPVWIRFSLRNDAPPARAWVLGIAWPMIDSIDFYPRDPVFGTWEPSLHSGIAAATDDKLVKDPAFVFPLDIPSGQARQYVMRLDGHTAYLVPMVVSEAAHYQRKRFDNSVWMGVLFGIIGVMFLYNLVLAVLLRERNYVAYSVYLLTVLLYELTVTGYGALYVWSGMPWLKAHDYEVFASAAFISASVFFRFFLNLKHARPAHLRWLNSSLIAYWAITLVVAAVWPNRMLLNLSAVMALWTSFAGMYIALVLSVQGNRFARYFLVAWAMVAVGTVASMLSLLGVVDGNWFTENGQHIGFALEILLLSVLLAERIRFERESREAAQRESLELIERIKLEREEKIRAQAHAMQLQARANEDLERRVIDRTAQVERAMHELAEANVALAELSITDALTKVHNRRYFDEVLAKEYGRSERTQVPLAVMMVDLDHFKRVNDSFGHLAGDECLKLVAATLRAAVGRSTDLIARYGGEEFALVLSGTDATQAVEVAERVRQSIEKLDFTYHGQRIPVTVSLGVVAKVATREQSISEFLAEADAALYREKNAGRNRVELAQTS